MEFFQIKVTLAEGPRKRLTSEQASSQEAQDSTPGPVAAAAADDAAVINFVWIPQNPSQLVDSLNLNIGNLECSGERACLPLSRIKTSELPARNEQRSQVKQRRRLSVSRTPSQVGWWFQEKTEPPAVAAASNARKCARKLNAERGTNNNNIVAILNETSSRNLKLIYGALTSSSARATGGCNALSAKTKLLDDPQVRVYRSTASPSQSASSQLLIFGVFLILLIGHTVPGAHLKSIDSSRSISVDIDGSILATLARSLQSNGSAAEVAVTLASNQDTATQASTDTLLETIATTTTTSTSTDQDDSSSQDDDHDAEGCQGLSVGDSAEAKNYTDNERLVNLQTCIQRKIERRLKGSRQFGLEMFQQLAISGGCTSSIMKLAGGLNEIKSFAFKFLDATAKMPSGVMYGLLSDFGDFDQCLSIRSNPNVDPENEAEEGAFSGKYCLVSVKLNYHAHLEGNSTVPEGIKEDGILWDELVRNYWTTKSPKGFQAGVCLPSRCTRDDLDQIYKYVADSYNVVGQVISCQDSLDLRNQYKPDTVQRLIIYAFYTLIATTLIGSLLDRYRSNLSPNRFLSEDNHCFVAKNCCIQILLCFSLQRNWRSFVRTSNPNSNNWDSIRIGNKSASSSTDDSCAFNERASLDSRDLSDQVRQVDTTAPPTGSDETSEASNRRLCNQLTVHIQPINECADLKTGIGQQNNHNVHKLNRNSLKHLSGLRLLIILWITIGHSFLYPSANNYQYYRSIINMNITRDSVWFATTNFTLGIDMLLYMTGLLFVYKLAHLSPTLRSLYLNSPMSLKSASRAYKAEGRLAMKLELKATDLTGLIIKKMLRFWPTYLTLIGMAILVPLVSDGPMWPEMVSKRLGESCRRNWWSNLLFINNFLNESDICLPSSWFVSILMQLFLIGSLVILLVRRYSLRIALIFLLVLLVISSGLSFAFAYVLNVRAPMIRMDESFVMELDESIFRLYTTIFNNLGPFLIGMIGGFLLVYAELTNIYEDPSNSPPKEVGHKKISCANIYRRVLIRATAALVVATIAALVLSSVFHQDYSRFWASIYWSLHRVGWAIVTGYIIHNCATGRCKLLNDVLSISAFVPINRLIPIAYLVYPIYIHMHSGLVRDGLHVSIYNMLNIYITRLVLTFTTALIVHLLVELPFCSLVELYANKWICNNSNSLIELNEDVEKKSTKLHPLLAIAPTVTGIAFDGKQSENTVEGNDNPSLENDKKTCNNADT